MSETGQSRARKIVAVSLALPLLYSVLLAVAPRLAQPDPQTVYLDSDGGPCVNQPSPTARTFFFSKTLPSGTPKCKDSSGLNFAKGNPWAEIGTWTTVPTAGGLGSLNGLHVWLGLKNSDDQGTQFDILAEVYKGSRLITSGLTRCIVSLTRNPAFAKDTAVSFSPFPSVTFDGTTDRLTLRILTRIGTTTSDTKCPGPGGSHASARGLRLYYGSADRPSGLKIVDGTNRAPVADAGPGQTVHPPVQVTLDGSRSTDADGDAITYRWSFVSKPDGSLAALSDPSLVNPTFVADLPGEYVVQLVVTDALGQASAPATVTISRVNTAPVANAGPNQTVHPVASVQLTGAGSTDVDGDALTYAWSLVSKPDGSSADLSDPSIVNPTFVADLPGEYVGQLVVTDALGQLSPPATVTISSRNTLPVANAGLNQTVHPVASVQLTGAGSTDADGDALTYYWAFLSTPQGSTAELSDPRLVAPTFTADRLGEYVLQLVVNDGLVPSSPATVTISTRNTAPVADPGPDQSVFLGARVTVDGRGSTDVDGDLLTYRWALLSVPEGSTASLSCAIDRVCSFDVDLSGTYVAQLIVNDGFVDSAPATVRVTTENRGPVARAGADQTVHPPATVQLDGSASTDPEGNGLTFLWALLSKPAGSDAELSDPGARSPTFAADIFGTYVAQLTVNDGLLDSQPSTVTISTSNSAPTAHAGPDQSVATDVTVTLDGSESADADGDPLTYAWSFASRPAGSTALLEGSTTALPTFVPDADGSYVIQLIVKDQSVASVPNTAVVTAARQNTEPTAQNDSFSTDEDVSLVVAAPGVLANDSDLEGDPLTAELGTQPAHGLVALAADGGFTYTPNPGFRGGDSFTYKASDGRTTSASATVTITVRPVNHRPVIATTPVTTATVGKLYTYGVGAVDPDPGDVVTFSLTLAPAGMVIDQGNGVIQWTPAAGQAGSQTVTVVVRDAGGLTGDQSFGISVGFPNRPPVITSIPPTSATAGQPLLYQVQAEDPDTGDTQTFSLDSAPLGMTLDAATGLLMWTPTDGQVGTHDVAIRVQDQGGLFVVQTFSIGVVAAVCVPPPDLVGWWPGDGSAADIAGSNHGTLMGGATFAGGKVAQAFRLDGVNAFVNLGNAPALHVSGGDFTVDAWVFFNALPPGDMSIVDKMSHPTNHNSDGWRLIKQQDNRFWFCFGLPGNGCTSGGATTVQSNVSPTTGVWFHVAGVKSSNTISIYIDGVLQQSKTIATFVDTDATGVLIGANGPLNYGYFNGLIDEVEIYNRALSPAEVRSIFDAGSAGIRCKPGPNVAIVPDVVGLTQVGAEAAIQVALLVTGTITTLPSSTAPAGQVLGQMPAAGTEVAKGSAVNLVLSSGFGSPPHITSIPLLAATTGEPYTYAVAASDPDAGDIIAFALQVAPTGMTIDPATGLVQWTPATQQDGDHPVTVRVVDSTGQFDIQPFTITVASTPLACVLPPKGLLSWWTGDDTPTDLTGRHHGTLEGGATFGPGKVGRAFRFTPGAGSGLRVRAQAGTNLILNGGFEAGVSLPGPAGIRNLGLGNTDIAGWTVTGASVSWIETNWHPDARASGGSYFLDLTEFRDNPPFGGVSQTVATIPGAKYRLSFDLGGFTHDAGTGIRATADSFSQVFQYATTSRSDWKRFTLDFTASTTTTIVQFTGVAAGHQFYIGLDNVELHLLDSALNPADAITVEAWTNPSSYSSDRSSIVQKGSSTAGGVEYFLGITHDGQAQCRIVTTSESPNEVVGGNVPLNEWTHVACTYDRNAATPAVRLYVNGVEVASAPVSGREPITSTNTELWIGNEPPTLGAIDLVFSTLGGGVGRRGVVNCNVTGPGGLGAGIVIAPSGDLILMAQHPTNPGPGAILRFSLADCTRMTDLVPAGHCPGFTQPRDVAMDAKGRLNVASISSTVASPGACTSLGSVFRFDATSGACIDTIPPTPTINGPLGVAIAANEDVYVSQPAARVCGYEFGVYRFTSEGAPLDPAFEPTLSAPGAITFGPDGLLYYAEDTPSGVPIARGIFRCAPGCGCTRFIDSPQVTGFAFHPDNGDIYAAVGPLAGDIYRFDGRTGAQVGGPIVTGVFARYLTFVRPTVTPVTGHEFDGLVDEVTIYYRALSGQEIETIASAGERGKCKTGLGGSVPATGGTCHAPLITSTPVTSGKAEQLYHYAVTASDPEPADVLSFSLTAAPAGMVIDVSTGLIAWTPASSQVGFHEVSIRVQDPAGLIASQDFTVQVLPASGGPTIVIVPDVVGLEQATAEAAILAATLTVGLIATDHSPTIPAGRVMSQSPAAGTSVVAGEAVNLVVSLGATIVTVPNVVGLEQATAQGALSAAGLTVGTVTQIFSDTVPTGRVITQSPEPGASVAQGTAVDLAVSKGPAPVAVPGVIGLTQADASAALMTANLVLGTVTTAYSDTVPIGRVISQAPVAGTLVSKNSAVNVVVSLGPAPVTVPNLVGLSESQATSAITTAQLAVGSITRSNSDTVPTGRVITQSPEPGASVAQGTAVDLAVSKGPAPVAVPGVIGLTQADASAALMTANLVLGTVTTAYSDTVPIGRVISQAPVAGTLVSKNSAVNVVVSLGPAPVTVPNLVGLSESQATSAITTAQLAVGSITRSNSDTVPAGAVINQTPPAGTAVPKGSAVSFVVSLGPVFVTVPAVVGRTETDARRAIIAAELTVGTITTQSSPTVPPGVVISQSPVAGAAALKGSAVALVVSSGPPIQSILVTPATGLILTERSQAFTAVGIRSDGTSQSLAGLATWSSTTPAVATVDTAGVAIGVAEGATTIRATLGSLIGTATLTVKTAVPDSTFPTAEISAPIDDATVTAPIAVTGTATDTNFLKYVLAIAPVGTSTFTTIATGTTPVVDGVLGTLDPTLLINDLYDLRLTVFDLGGKTAATRVRIQVSREQKVGNFTLAFKDVSMPAVCLPVTVTRRYDSRDKTQGDFGVGWRLDVQTMRLRESRSPQGTGWEIDLINEPGPFGTPIPTFELFDIDLHKVAITMPDGKVEEFDLTPSPDRSEINPITSVTAIYTPRPGTVGSLAVDGNTSLDIFETTGPVTLREPDLSTFDPPRFRYTAPDGTVFFIDKVTGVQRVQCTTGLTLTFEAGRIAHSLGQSVGFIRDGQGRITRITDPNGNAHTYAYDANGDLESYTDAEGNVTRYLYDARHGLIEIRDPRGAQAIRNDYDDAGRLIASTDSSGQSIQYTHDLVARRETVTDRLGNATVYEYDGQGNVTRQTDALGGLTQFTHDGFGNETSRTDPLGRTTTREFGTKRNVVSETTPAGNTTRFTYTGLLAVATITDPLLHVTTNTYDGAGNLLSTTNPDTGTTTFAYDGRGLMISRQDALGHVTTYGYDAAGRLVAETDAGGHTTSYTYDASGNRRTQTTVAGVETYTYDRLNRLVSTTRADGSTTQIAYNTIGKQSVTTDPLGRETRYEYDAQGRLSQTTFPDGTSESATYDAEGRRVTSTDRAGRLTTYAYDALGRLTATTYPDGATSTTTYDAAGQVLATTDPRGNTSTHTYDPDGRRTAVIDPLGRTTSFAYDKDGKQTRVTDANGNATTFEYDVHRRTKVVHPEGTTDQTGYDPIGRQSSKTDQADKTTEYDYDPLGRLTRVTDAVGQMTQYTYDKLGRRLTQTDANGHTTSFAYDALGRRTQRTLPLGMSETYQYDAAGNLASKTDFNGKTTTYTYDGVNRLLQKVPDPSFAAPTISFSYTPTGQRASMSDASGVTTYAYDQRDRLITKATPQGTLSYTYDAAGSVTSIQSSNANGTSVNYEYDARSRLVKVIANRLANGVTTYTYDGVGNLTGYVYPNGVATSHTYNTLNRLTNLTVAKTATLASFTYTLGATGNRLSVAELSGRQVDYAYDGLYRLTRETITGDTTTGNNGTIGYTYDPVGNRQSRTSSVAPIATTTYGYDANDRLLSDTYDDNGNVTSANGRTFTYSFENRLTQADAGGVTLVYDGDGNRVSRTSNNVTTRYLIDERNPTRYAQVLEELTGSDVSRVYAYGLYRTSQSQASGTSFYGYDGHGNVRLLTDTTGATANRYNYDAFGIQILSNGTTPNDFLYSGEQNDSALGAYNLRARYYDASSGGFLTADPVEGHVMKPLSLHRYLYADANPVDNRDPSGNLTLTESITTVAIVGILTNVAPGGLNLLRRKGGGSSSFYPDAVVYGISVSGAANALANLALVTSAIGVAPAYSPSGVIAEALPALQQMAQAIPIGLGATIGVEIVASARTREVFMVRYAGGLLGDSTSVGGSISLNFYQSVVWDLDSAKEYSDGWTNVFGVTGPFAGPFGFLVGGFVGGGYHGVTYGVGITLPPSEGFGVGVGAVHPVGGAMRLGEGLNAVDPWLAGAFGFNGSLLRLRARGLLQ